MQVEKMVIILKELEHIQNILDFFNGYKAEECKEKPIKQNIAYLKEDIFALQKKIKNLKKINQDLDPSDLMLFLIQYDYIRTQIEDMLRVIQALYNKMQQLFGETLNQYLPYPTLGRRYSNNGIMMYLGNYYREMLKSFSEDNEPSNKLILGWNYRTGFQYRVFVNRETKRENYKEDTFNDYIDLPYWYYELPMLLPSITHEVSYIALRKPNKKMKVPFENLKEEIKLFLNDKSNNYVQKVQDVIGYDEYGEDLSKVIFCDVIGLKTHGESYINALFHNILGEKLSKDYLKITHRGEKEYFKILPNEWYFIQKKDHSILRLHFLLSLSKDHSDYKNMKKLVNNIMPLTADDKPYPGFDQTYRYNYPNFRASYQSVQNYLTQLLKRLEKWEKINQNKLDAIIPPESPDFNKLWKNRYEVQRGGEDTVMHQNNFRQSIHTEISKIDYLVTSHEKNESIIYLMELGKARKDINQNKDINIIQMITDNIDKDKNASDEEERVTKLSVYGIYDWVTITRKRSSFNITERFENLLQKIPTENTSPIVDGLRYFKAKQVLMKVHQTIKGHNQNNINPEFSVIFNIELSKKIDSSECTNGYNKLKLAISNIAKKLDKHLNNFKTATIYKSLGPKDLTLIINDASLEFIFEFLTELNKQESDSEEGKVLRTFTMLCSEFNKLPKIEDNFVLISYLRISNDFKEDDLEKMKQNTLMRSLHEVTGVMDFRVEWKKEASIADVLNFYNEMLEHSYLTDFQTKIERELL